LDEFGVEIVGILQACHLDVERCWGWNSHLG
jgi:hypothetical protein